MYELHFAACRECSYDAVFVFLADGVPALQEFASKHIDTNPTHQRVLFFRMESTTSNITREITNLMERTVRGGFILQDTQEIIDACQA